MCAPRDRLFGQFMAGPSIRIIHRWVRYRHTGLLPKVLPGRKLIAAYTRQNLSLSGVKPFVVTRYNVELVKLDFPRFGATFLSVGPLEPGLVIIFGWIAPIRPA